MTVSYPDIQPIITAKEQRRQALAALSWEEKVAIVDQMRRLLPRRQWRHPDLVHEAVARYAEPDDSIPPAVEANNGV